MTHSSFKKIPYRSIFTSVVFVFMFWFFFPLLLTSQFSLSLYTHTEKKKKVKKSFLWWLKFQNHLSVIFSLVIILSLAHFFECVLVGCFNDIYRYIKTSIEKTWCKACFLSLSLLQLLWMLFSFYCFFFFFFFPFCCCLLWIWVIYALLCMLIIIIFYQLIFLL